MLRTLAISLTLAISQTAHANGMMSCDDSVVAMVQAKLNAADASLQKDRRDFAATELDLAKQAKLASEADDCSMHLANAMNALMRN